MIRARGVVGVERVVRVVDVERVDEIVSVVVFFVCVYVVWNEDFFEFVCECMYVEKFRVVDVLCCGLGGG